MREYAVFGLNPYEEFPPQVQALLDEHAPDEWQFDGLDGTVLVLGREVDESAR